MVRSGHVESVTVSASPWQEATTAAQEERARAWLFSLINRRLELWLPLLASTNCTAEQLAGTEGGKSAVRADPLLRRLLEIAEPVRFLPRA